MNEHPERWFVDGKVYPDFGEAEGSRGSWWNAWGGWTGDGGLRRSIELWAIPPVIEKGEKELEMIWSEVSGWRRDDDVCHCATSLDIVVLVLGVDVSVQDACFPCECSKWDAENLLAVSLSTIGIDINCNGYNREEDLMFNKILLIEEFIEDIGLLQFN